ncbi:hypothetical protein CRG98_039346 [Punica granatum]|uniref:Uncharacterized protein n=1 Tax=Punica granatum TaxID=22663 RepID=A0A2I0I8Y8_PUNGR|nr:hypothetical protein CRG98_039346 [Punica granatum]
MGLGGIHAARHLNPLGAISRRTFVHSKILCSSTSTRDSNREIIDSGPLKGPPLPLVGCSQNTIDGSNGLSHEGYPVTTPSDHLEDDASQCCVDETTSSFSIAISVLPEYASSAIRRVVGTPSRLETRVGRVVRKSGSTMPWATAVQPMSVRYCSMVDDSNGAQADSTDCLLKPDWRLAWKQSTMHGFGTTGTMKAVNKQANKASGNKPEPSKRPQWSRQAVRPRILISSGHTCASNATGLGSVHLPGDVRHKESPLPVYDPKVKGR